VEASGVALGAATSADLGVGRRTGATGRFGTTDRFGAACGLGAADRFGAVGRFGAAARFGATARFAATAWFAATARFGIGRRFRAAARPRAAERRTAFAGFDALRVGARDFGDLRRDAVEAAFAPAEAFADAADFRTRSRRADLAALAFFLACLAAFLLAFASFRACLSAFLAARRRRFAASASAVAWLASDSSRRAAAVWLACDEGDLEVATSYSLK
jgi:hypothetical protein